MKEMTGIFWIAGNPGSGKSTLMKHIFWHPTFRDHIWRTAEPRRVVIAGHFFDHKTEGLGRSMEGLYRSIIWQLLQREPRLFTHVLKVFSELQSYQGAVSWTRHDLEQIFRAMINSIQSEDGDSISQELHYCIFVDALDEFDGQDYRIATFLEEMMNSTNSNLMICTSSRPRSDFAHQFSAYQQLSMHLETRHDISLYALKTCPELSNHQLPEYRALVNIIIDKSDGIFLWVRLVCDRLRKGSRKGETATALRLALIDLPTDLFKLYQRMFDEIEEDDRDEAHELFAIVSAASRILTLSELRCVIAFSTTAEPSLPPSFTKRKRNMRNDAEHIRLQNRIRGICGGLIETRPSADDMVVVPIHATIRTFLRQSCVSTKDILVDNMLSYGHLILLNATTRDLQTLSTADLPFKRTKLQFRSDHGLISFQNTEEKSADGHSLPSSQWSMTTAAGQNEHGSFLDWSAAYNLLEYSTQMWALHARNTDINSMACMISYVDRIRGSTFQIWREVFWESVKSAGEVDLIPDDMPCDVLEHAFACDCVVYAKARFCAGNMVDVEHPERLLLGAIRSGSLELCQLLLKSFKKQDFVNTDIPDPFLHFAIDFSHPELISTLVAYGFNLIEPVGYSLRHKRWTHAPNLSIRTRFVVCTALDLAVLLHRNDIVCQLLALYTSQTGDELPKSDLKSILEHENTIHPTNIDGIHLLLQYGITPDIEPGFHPSLTPIGYSIRQQNHALFCDLLQHGANVDYANGGDSLLSFAIITNQEGSHDTARHLLACGARPNISAFLAALDHRLDILGDLLRSSNLSIDSLFDEEQTLIHQAITTGNISTVRLLMSEYYADPNIPNSSSDYPIHTAFIWPEQEAFDIITALCCSGKNTINLYVKDNQGRTPFELALFAGYTKVVAKLAEAGLKLEPTFVQFCIASLSQHSADYISSIIEQDIAQEDGTRGRLSSRQLYAPGLSKAAHIDMWISGAHRRLIGRGSGKRNLFPNNNNMVLIDHLEAALALATGAQ
jgi:ankyrin repeat protein